MVNTPMVVLINTFARYSVDDPDMDITDFCLRYLSEQAADMGKNGLEGFEEPSMPSAPPPAPRQERTPTEAGHADQWPSDHSLNGLLAKLVGRLNKYAYFYTKKALQPLHFSSIDDMVYLQVIRMHGNPRKSDVIHAVVSEFPSGIDIIKRLVKMGWVTEQPDADDKRSKRLTITPAGVAVLEQSYPLLNIAAEIAYGTLSNAEKLMVARLLHRLDVHHWAHYREARGMDDIGEIAGYFGVGI